MSSDSDWEKAKAEYLAKFEHQDDGEDDDGDPETICQCGVRVNDEPVCYWCGWNHEEKKYEPEEAS